MGSDEPNQEPRNWYCNFSFKVMLSKAVEQLIWFQNGKFSDGELNEKIKHANEQTLGDIHTSMASIPLPSLEAAEQLRQDLQNPTYKTREERFKDVPPFMRTDLSFNFVMQTYRTAGQPGTAWQPGEMDDTMDKVAYLTAVICERVFGEGALSNLCNQFNHSKLGSEILWYLQPHEQKELETRMEKAAYCAGWEGWDEI